MTIQELWHINQSFSEIIVKHISEPAKGEIVIEARYSLISQGTERLVATGGVPESIEAKMLVQGMEGSFRFPVKYGYSLVGKVILGSKDLVNKHVYLMHPHQDYVILENYNYHIIPDEIPIRRAALFPFMETALTILWDSGVSAGDRVLVCGFGIVGTITALLLRRIPGVYVTVLEKDNHRSQVAKSFGFEKFHPEIRYDCSINTSASEEGLQTCIDTTIDEGTIVEASWYGNNSVKLHLGMGFHPGRKKIISSQVSHIPVNRAGRFTYLRRAETVFNLLNDELLDSIPIAEISLEEAPDVFDMIRKQKYDPVCTMIKY